MEDQQNTNSKNDFIEEPKIENDTELSEEQIIEQLKKELEEKQDLILRTAAEAVKLYGATCYMSIDTAFYVHWPYLIYLKHIA